MLQNLGDWLTAEWARTVLELSTASGWAGLLVLTMIELVLVIDNAVVILCECESLPQPQRRRMERYGLIQGAVLRILGLCVLGSLATLATPIEWMQSTFGWEVSVGGLIRIVGGIFLLYLATTHINGFGIHHETTRHHEFNSPYRLAAYLFLISGIFSVDSILSAVGTVEVVGVMIIAVLISVIVLVTSVGALSRLLAKHPQVKLFAMALVFAIGVVLVYEGVIGHFEKPVLYGAMFFGMALTALYTWKSDYLYPAARIARCDQCGEPLICHHCGASIPPADILGGDKSPAVVPN